jgi:hypothetical protein
LLFVGFLALVMSKVEKAYTRSLWSTAFGSPPFISRDDVLSSSFDHSSNSINPDWNM